ncbi:MAG: hypothetical protein WC381_06650 [Kiritimatiellia bacterium]
MIMERRTKNEEQRTVSGLSAAFSLVEVSLALMVMAIGVLSVMSLFPAGLEQNNRSIADTHAAFFAEEVFAGLQARAETNWAELESTPLPIAASTKWNTPNLLQTEFTSTMFTNTYAPISMPTYDDHALRYRLVLTNVVANGVTNSLLKAVTLSVWPGEFGTTNDPAMFYAEFFNASAWNP